jgi:hypothetical protein
VRRPLLRRLAGRKSVHRVLRRRLRYCSRACVSDGDCDPEATGLVCDHIVLDPDFLTTLDEAARQRYLAEVASTTYCLARRR